VSFKWRELGEKMNVLTSASVKGRLSSDALAFCANGNFITADQKAQLIAQGVSRKMLEEMDELRGRLLGGMKKASEKDPLPLSYIRQLLQSDFSEGKNRFMSLLIGLGSQDDQERRRTREEMHEVLEIGLNVLKSKDLFPEEFRFLLKKLLTSLTHFPELRKGQTALAYLAAQNELVDAKARPVGTKLSLFINATYYYAKTFSLDPQNDQPLQEISKIFMRIIEEMIAPNFEASLDGALRREDGADYFKEAIDRIPDLEKFQNNERDYQTIQNLYKRAENVIQEFEKRRKEIPDSLQKLLLEILQRLSIPYEPKDPTSPIRKYREMLEEFREFFRGKRKEIQPETARLIQREIHKHFLSFFKVLLDDVFLILGPPPCRYDLRAYGSLARKEFCPYSDLEWMILIEKEEGRSYFKILAQLLSLQIISIGETAPADFPIFSATGSKHLSGFHVDSGGDPGQIEHLIGTPEVLACLQAFRPEIKEPEKPIENVYSLRNTISLRTTDPDLFKKYAEKMHEILDTDDLRKKRAVDFLKFRLANYKKLFAEDWRKTPTVNLKEQFLELLYHPLSDLGLYFGCHNLNTLDVIDELPCFTSEGRSLLKEAVSFLYKLRLKLHLQYGEQKEEASQISKEVEGFICLKEKEKFLLEATYLLILCPFYSYLENLFSQENFAIGEIPLLDLAFEKACKESGTPDARVAITHLAKHLARSENPDKRYYKQLSDKKLERLREVYCNALQEAYRFHPGSDLLKNLILSLEKIPDSYGNRLVLKRKRLAFLQKLSKITSLAKPSIGKYSAQIYSPFFEKRYLFTEVLDAILDETGHIKKQLQNTNSRVSSYEKGSIAFHFKEKPTNYKKESPFHPGREHAATELMFRLFGRGTSISELFEFEVEMPNKEPQKYLVLISETVPGSSPDPDHPPFIDPVQLSELFLSIPLLLPGDMRSANLITTADHELISVDNDVSWIKPYTKDGYNLYTILPFLYPDHILQPDAIQAFLALKPVQILTSWLEEIVGYNEKILSAFKAYEEIPEKKAWFSYTYYTSACCFERGTGAQLFLQFHQLQEFLRMNQDREIRGIEVLRTIISLDQGVPAPVGDRIYQAYQKVQERQDIRTGDKAKEVTQRRAIESTTMTGSTVSFYRKIPQNKEELLNCAPQHAIEEIETHAILKINEGNGLSLRRGEFSSLDLQRKDIFKEITPANQRSLFKSLSLYKFEQLNLSFSCLEDMELKDILEKTGEYLKVLNLRDCSNLTEKAVGFISQYCPLLEELYLSRCSKIKTFTVGWFQNAVVFSNLKILHLTSCQNLRSFKIDAPKLTALKIEGTPPNQDLALSLNNVGIALSILGRYAEAQEYQKLAFEMGKQFFKEPHENLAVFLTNIGLNLLNLGRYYEALECYRQSVDMRNRLFQNSCKNIAISLHDIGIALDGLGRYSEALNCFQQALKIQRQLSKAPHQDLASALNGVGVAFNHLGKYVKALDYHHQALQMNEQFFQDPHISLSMRLNNIAGIGVALNGLEKYADACDYLLKALKMTGLLFEGPHRFTAAVLSRVGVSLNGLGKSDEELSDEGLKYFEQAREMRRFLFGENHFGITESQDELGKTSANLGGYQEGLKFHEEALKYFEQALEMRKSLFGEKHFDITESLDDVGETLGNLGRHKEALEYHKEALLMGLTLSPQNDAYIARSLYLMGLEEHYFGFEEKALNHFQEALSLKKKVFRKPNRDTEKLHEDLQSIQDQRFADLHAIFLNRDIVKCLTSIAETYKNLEEADEASAYEKKASEILQALEAKEASYWSKKEKLTSFNTMFESIGYPYQPFSSRTISLKNQEIESISKFKEEEKEYEQLVFPIQEKEILDCGFSDQKDRIQIPSLLSFDPLLSEFSFKKNSILNKILESVNKEKTNPEDTKTWYRVRDLREENSFRVKIENGQLVWQAFGIVDSNMIRDIAEVYQRKYPDRTLVVNTGVFANEVGEIVYKHGSEEFIREDMATFRDNDNVKIHVVSPSRPPYTHRDGITKQTDILDAWCFSARTDRTKGFGKATHFL